MRMMLGGAAVCALVVVAGCGDQRAPAALDEPLETAATATPTPTPIVAPAAGTPDGVLTRIPDDFPLLDGYPSDADAEPEEHNGREGPNRSMRPVVPEACGASVEIPEHADRLRAGWTNPEDYRQRQLLAFADADRAQAYADDVLDLYRDCAREVTSEEMLESQHSTVEEGRLGDFSGVVISTYAYDDLPRPGMAVTYVVRVAAAVLVSVTYNEAGGGPDPDGEAAAQRDDAARQIDGVVDAMEVFRVAEPLPSEPAFGPDGFGQVTLGLARHELAALPGVRIERGNDQCERFTAPGVDGWVQPGLGVAVLQVVADLETPERIHVGSSYDEVRAAYPGATRGDPWVVAELPGERSYRFQLDRDRRVLSVLLLHGDQHCGG